MLMQVLSRWEEYMSKITIDDKKVLNTSLLVAVCIIVYIMVKTFVSSLVIFVRSSKCVVIG